MPLAITANFKLRRAATRKSVLVYYCCCGFSLQAEKAQTSKYTIQWICRVLIQTKSNYNMHQDKNNESGVKLQSTILILLVAIATLTLQKNASTTQEITVVFSSTFSHKHPQTKCRKSLFTLHIWESVFKQVL